MNTIREIIEHVGYESAQEMDVGDRIEVEGGNVYMDLTIEKVFNDRVSVAHYYTQRGDLMSDPEIVFDIDGDEWRAIRYTQHPRMHKHDPDGLPMANDFAETWSENLRKQGFVERATVTTND